MAVGTVVSMAEEAGVILKVCAKNDSRCSN